MAVLSRTFSKEQYKATYYVEETHEGMRLDQFLQIYLETWSRQEVKRRIAAGDVVIKDRPGKHRPSTALHYKEEITFTVNRTTQEDEYWDGKKIELDENPEIIYEDKELIVISKPAYMSTHPTGRHLFYCATVYFGEMYGHTIHSIHRLDRETSGVMMLGKTPQMSNQMGEQFIQDKVKKCYFFMAKENEDYHGETRFEANERLGASEGGLKRVYIDHYPEDSFDGKHARTIFNILHRENGYVLGLAFPQTGRQHQIRVHAMVNGLPLVGDKLYLGSFEMFQRFKDLYATKQEHELMELPRHSLHAIALQVNYQGEKKVFKSHLPKDFIPWIHEKLTISIPDLESKIEAGVTEYFYTI
ncbi:RluA family pseudouridine synthase [Bacteriovorax sp. DB6_IX]|uniref:RluA family pseudouridine synthase n=1 Tax=Bacteriovorax sp. DB6_IX TaxID=1353530 RepID=UPI000389FB8D|nr:RluA family pseudouridine synthase [Bacteriovorax sp. DB6_IX]EQC47961.1 pseudouridine synthase, RluA family [Bacteriovorax sp. DB6_IX]